MTCASVLFTKLLVGIEMPKVDKFFWVAFSTQKSKPKLSSDLQIGTQELWKRDGGSTERLCNS